MKLELVSYYIYACYPHGVIGLVYELELVSYYIYACYPHGVIGLVYEARTS